MLISRYWDITVTEFHYNPRGLSEHWSFLKSFWFFLLSMWSLSDTNLAIIVRGSRGAELISFLQKPHWNISDNHIKLNQPAEPLYLVCGLSQWGEEDSADEADEIVAHDAAFSLVCWLASLSGWVWWNLVQHFTVAGTLRSQSRNMGAAFSN